jgi:hypothetical protein
MFEKSVGGNAKQVIFASSTVALSPEGVLIHAKFTMCDFPQGVQYGIRRPKS